MLFRVEYVPGALIRMRWAAMKIRAAWSARDCLALRAAGKLLGYGATASLDAVSRLDLQPRYEMAYRV